MNLLIKKFHNRLGNNIRQLLYTIHIALFYNYNIFILPKHDYFNKKYISINENITLNNKKFITDRWNFFHKDRINGINKKLFKINHSKAIKILRTCFSIDVNAINLTKPLTSDDLVIHIRGGDIFVKPHYKYVMPPLSYYIKIIESRQFNRIIILSQDRKNPCVNILLKLYPNIEFKLRSLEEDVKIILSATNLVESYGTFTAYLLLFSNNIKNIYKPSYQFNTEPYFNSVNFIKANLKHYKRVVMGGSWKNSVYQRSMMLKYGMNEINKTKNKTKTENKNKNKNKIENFSSNISFHIKIKIKSRKH